MSASNVAIRLEGNGRVYYPGETLSGSYWLTAPVPEDVRAMEFSILWYTEGKGDEDLAVHSFRRLTLEEGEPIDLGKPMHFSTVLPASPLSYQGRIVKISWCVRLRVFLSRGRELFGQVHFRLGRIPPVKPVRVRESLPDAAATAAVEPELE